MPGFVRGVDLARAFYHEAVAPLLGAAPHAAGLLGWGSDVLGYDTARSMDHGWGPRLQVFVDNDDVASLESAIQGQLPDDFRGWSTRFGWDAVPVSHHVEVASLDEWLRARLGFDPSRGISTRDWLSTPQQILLEVTEGAVFHNGPGELTQVRESLQWYPDQVWLWMLACQWRRIDQEEPFVGRTAEVGDDLGSRVLAARLVRDFMRLALLLERRYAPYSKWLGTAFAQLDAWAAVAAALTAALKAEDYAECEAALTAAVEDLAARQNELGVTRPVEATVRLFHDRPYRVLGSGRFVEACLQQITDDWLRSLPLVGAIDQFADSTDVLSYPRVFHATGAMYENWAADDG